MGIQQTAEGVLAVAKLILSRTAGTLLLVHILPRAWLRDGTNPLTTVDLANAAVRRLAATTQPRAEGRLRLADCGAPFAAEVHGCSHFALPPPLQPVFSSLTVILIYW
jgi:hypothetical protein